MNAPKDRVMAVLEYAYRGLHHCPDIHTRVDNEKCYSCHVNNYADLSTFDFDTLTRLVFATHDKCVRVEIGASGPGMVKIILNSRDIREGSWDYRHPTLEEAVTEHRKRKSQEWVE